MTYGKWKGHAYQGFMVCRIRRCSQRGSLVLLETIVAIALDGLTDRCKTKDTLLPKILVVIHVMPIDIIHEISNLVMSVGKKLSQTLEV